MTRYSPSTRHLERMAEFHKIAAREYRRVGKDANAEAAEAAEKRCREEVLRRAQGRQR